MTLPEDWEINRDEDEIEIRTTGVETEKQLEHQVEADVSNLFNSLGITADKLKPRSDQGQKTSDCGGMDVDFEVTIVQSYIRGIEAIEKAWNFLQKNIGTSYCAYIYSDSAGKPVFKLLTEEKGMVKGLSMLCLRQHVSIYYKKIAKKIETKYRQHTTNQHQIIVLDFRITPFNTSSLRNEISKILQEIGEDYHYLLGIIFALPKTLASSPFETPNYFYVSNPYVNPPMALAEKLKNIAKVDDDTNLRIMPMLPLVVMSHTHEEHSISNVCFSCPSLDDLASQGMPV